MEETNEAPTRALSGENSGGADTDSENGRKLRVAYIGNFEPPFSTENYVYKALLNNGHDVMRLLERPTTWGGMLNTIERAQPDVLLWTSTNDYAPPETFQQQLAVLAHCAQRGIPTVGYHLDLWFGLQRAHLVDEKPFFTVDLLCTADGGHDEEWGKRGINHVWFPPAVGVDETQRIGEYREELAYDVVFVGSWQGGYHRESRHRRELIAWLKRQTQWKVGLVPPAGEPRWEGQQLADLYTSAAVVVGDSCLVPNIERYCSDRLPYVLGHGGFLLHPFVEGVLGGRDPLFIDGEHLVGWHAGDWGDLMGAVEEYLADTPTRHAIAAMGREHVIAHHTYDVRMRELVAELERQGMLSKEGVETRDD